MRKHLKSISAIAAFAIYFAMISLILIYFNQHDRKKPVHFVKKNDNRISVSLSSPKNSHRTEKKRQAAKTVKKREKPKYKKVKKKSAKKKKHIRKKSRTKKQNKKHTKREKKKSDIKKLFNKVQEKKTPKKTKRTKSRRDGKEGKNKDKGIQNAYFAKVERMLHDWPSQSEFAGEKIKVWLKIEKDGSFTYKVLSASNNEQFNEELLAYLRQLQKIGFGRHENSKAYELNVEFVARE